MAVKNHVIPNVKVTIPDNIGNDYKEKKETLTIWEIRDNNVKEVLDLLVNGNPISQLLLDKHIELTDRAKEELTTLREQSTSKLVESNNETIKKLQKEIANLKKENNELKAAKDALVEEKELLSTDIDGLKKRKALLIDSINSDLRVSSNRGVESSSEKDKYDVVIYEEMKGKPVCISKVTSRLASVEPVSNSADKVYMPFEPYYSLNGWDGELDQALKR